jgi:hypothetical protein
VLYIRRAVGMQRNDIRDAISNGSPVIRGYIFVSCDKNLTLTLTSFERKQYIVQMQK